MSSSLKAKATAVLTSSPMMANPDKVYKGKITDRSWSQLPPEVIRIITTHYILDVSSSGYVPRTWEGRSTWTPRLMYTILRDALDIEKLMRVCPGWHIALETHIFWQQACSVIDPTGKMSFLASPQVQPTAGSATPTLLTPYRYFRNISNISCHVCRVNDPYHSTGLGTAKRSMHNPYLKEVYVCKDHRKESYCGLCLRNAPVMENESDYHAVLCVENDDVDSWPGIHTTCRNCREEWLYRRISRNPKELEAVGGSMGGHKWESQDWETRQTVDSFIEIGEGSIQDVINVAMDKHWLRQYTKLPDMLEQAMAATKYTNREEGGYCSDDGSTDDEEDPELLSMTEDTGGVKELALNDWARNRILDGYWTSPADQWYAYTVHGLPTDVKAVHPTPWNRDATYERTIEDSEGGEILDHPRPATVQTDVPPSFGLCEQAFVAYQKQMRIILLPPMNNIVRRLVIESSADGVDPAIRATRMDMDDVIKELGDEASWYNGIDWLERRANGEREMRNRAVNEDDEHSTSSKSSSSNTTSPVLSTSTLQTTPSPPASVDGHDTKKDDEPIVRSRGAPVIPIAPVLTSPVLLHPIPYVPVTVSHMPQYSLDALKIVWREACAPLYHCRCSICERAALTANVAAGNIVPSQIVHSVSSAPVTPYIPSTTPREAISQHVEIKIEEAPREVVEALREEEEESVEEEEEEDWEVCAVNPRKRPSHDIDADDDADGEADDQEEHTLRKRRSGSLTKRLRREEDYTKDIPVASPTRLRKRPSEELDDDLGVDEGFDADGREVGTKKRLRVHSTPSEDAVTSPPVSIIGAGESDSVPPTGDEDDLGLNPSPRGRSVYAQHPRSLKATTPIGMTEADMDKMYTFDASGTVTNSRDEGVDV